MTTPADKATARHAAGRCVSCAARRAKGSWRCKACASAYRAKAAARRAAAREGGPCVECSEPAAQGRGGRCDAHADAHNETQRRSRANRKAGDVDE